MIVVDPQAGGRVDGCAVGGVDFVELRGVVGGGVDAVVAGGQRDGGVDGAGLGEGFLGNPLGGAAAVEDVDAFDVAGLEVQGAHVDVGEDGFVLEGGEVEHAGGFVVVGEEDLLSAGGDVGRGH